MNREILFRGKHIDNGEWVYGWYCMYPFGRWPCKHAIIPSQDAVDGEHKFVEVDPGTVGQFTELSDKNGKKIFEGDIIRWDEKEWGKPFSEVITWDYGLFSLRKSDWKEFCEVVGNIHDNPELIKSHE